MRHSNERENKQNNNQNAEVGDKKSPTILRFMNRKWMNIWKGNPPGPVLLIIGMFVAFIMSVPIVYVIWRSIFAGADSWTRLLGDRIPKLLWDTLSLTAAVTFTAVFIGVTLAWIVVRTDLPGKKMWQWLMALPLVIPPYVGAVTYIIVFGPSGWAARLWRDSVWLMSNVGDSPINIYSFWGVFLVLTLFTYPYVFLFAR